MLKFYSYFSNLFHCGCIVIFEIQKDYYLNYQKIH